MRHRLVLLLLVAAVFLAVLPASAQRRQSSSGGYRVRPSHNFPQTNTGNPNFNFIPGFGLQPAVQERYPVPGYGFDYTHDNLVRGHRGNRGHRGHHPFFPGRGFGGFGGGFIGGSYFGPNFAVGGYYPFYPLGGYNTNVVYVQQPVPVPVVIEDLRYDRGDDGDVAVAPGLPDDWPRLRVAANSYTPVQEPLPALTLLVLRDEKILAVKEYWLEDGKVFYVTSSGRQGSFAVRDLDWQMTTRLNANRGLDFALENQE